jgi:hypothetical protein
MVRVRLGTMRLLVAIDAVGVAWFVELLRRAGINF